MSLVTKPPPPSVPLGRLPDGTPVHIDVTWDLFLRAVVERIGGVSNATLPEVANRIQPPMIFPSDDGNEIPMVIPGPQGEPGKETVSYVLLVEQEESTYYFLPMG